MSQIKGRNTNTELYFRRYIWNKRLGGYRISDKILGKPDLYFRKQKIAVFIDGCFWHKCQRCFKKPKSNNHYWDRKIKDNVARDKKINQRLKKQDIIVLRFWEHEIKNNIDNCYNKLRAVYEKRNNYN